MKSNWGERSQISDPVTCGEDLEFNLQRALAIAPGFCKECGDYHVAKAAMRLSGRSSWNGVPKLELITEMRSQLTRLAPNRDSSIEIVIAGAGDTGILSTCAHAAACVDKEALSRIRFTILDKCRTPLELCREYGTHHQLCVSTHAQDLVAIEVAFPADLIVMHSILNFIPRESQVGLLLKFGRWLKPGGRIICWNSILQRGDNVRRDLRRRLEATETTRRTICASGITSDVSLRLLSDHLSRWATSERGEPRVTKRSLLRDLFSAAGLHVFSIRDVEIDAALQDGKPLKSEFAMIVAGAAPPAT